MKSLILIAITFVGLQSFAEPVVLNLPGSPANLNIAKVRETIVVGRNASTDQTYSIQYVYNGQSTDLSPLYEVYFTMFLGGEMNNISATWRLGSAYAAFGADRQSAGVYTVNLLTDLGHVDVYTINVNGAFATALELSKTLEDFEDPNLSQQLVLSVTKQENYFFNRPQ